MKRLWIFAFLAILVAGCTTREYDSNMELGKSQLKEENYLEAHEAFELAYKDSKTAEAKELKELSGFLADGMLAYEDEKFDKAQAHFKEAAAYKAKYKEGKQMVKKAEEMLGQSLDTEEVPEEVLEDKADEPVSSEPADEASKKSPKPVPEKTKPPVTESDAEDDTAIETESPDDLDQEIEEKEQQEGKKEAGLTKEEAEQLVKDYIDMEQYPQLEIEYDHDDKEKGDYVFQVFEVVNDSEEGGHTATWGWYGVNKETKEVYEMM